MVDVPGDVLRPQNLFLSYMNNKDADQPAHPHSLISAFVLRCLDTNEVFKGQSYIAGLSPTCQFAERVLSLHVHLFKV